MNTGRNINREDAEQLFYESVGLTEEEWRAFQGKLDPQDNLIAYLQFAGCSATVQVIEADQIRVSTPDSLAIESIADATATIGRFIAWTLRDSAQNGVIVPPELYLLFLMGKWAEERVERDFCQLLGLSEADWEMVQGRVFEPTCARLYYAGEIAWVRANREAGTVTLKSSNGEMSRPLPEARKVIRGFISWAREIRW